VEEEEGRRGWWPKKTDGELEQARGRRGRKKGRQSEWSEGLEGLREAGRS